MFGFTLIFVSSAFHSCQTNLRFRTKEGLLADEKLAYHEPALQNRSPQILKISWMPFPENINTKSPSVSSRTSLFTSNKTTKQIDENSYLPPHVISHLVIDYKKSLFTISWLGKCKKTTSSLDSKFYQHLLT